jgi:hypothetical protein
MAMKSMAVMCQVDLQRWCTTHCLETERVHNCITCLAITNSEITLLISWFRALKRINFQINFLRGIT